MFQLIRTALEKRKMIFLSTDVQNVPKLHSSVFIYNRKSIFCA